MTTSLNVHPNWRRTRLASSSGMVVQAKRRCGVIGLFHGVRGA